MFDLKIAWCYYQRMSEAQPKPVQPEQKRPEGPPAGMTQKAWEEMQLAWGMFSALNGESTPDVQEAAQGDTGMEAILRMTKGLLDTGEKMGLKSDKVFTALQDIVPKVEPQTKPGPEAHSTPLPETLSPEPPAPTTPVPPAK